jgi:hypothetical protein
MLRALEATEANLAKLDRLWGALQEKIPDGVCFGTDVEYDSLRHRYADIVSHMPAIDGWRLTDSTLDLNEIAQWRFDAHEIDEPSSIIAAEEAVQQPGRDLAEFRFRYDRKRRSMVRSATTALIANFDQALERSSSLLHEGYVPSHQIPPDVLTTLREIVDQIDTLLGSSVKRPTRWVDLRRHLRFGQLTDLDDIRGLDWPEISPKIQESLYGEDEPIPVAFDDLGDLEAPMPHSPIPTGLQWERISAGEFERLIYALLISESGYANPQWLMHTTAPDRGRDLSATRVTRDSLSGVRTERVIVQCKHWAERSIGVSDVSVLRDQMRLWEPPRVDVLIIATSGRFSADAVRLIECHNQSEASLRLEMWPDSHLERLLAERPALIGEFNLRA